MPPLLIRLVSCEDRDTSQRSTVVVAFLVQLADRKSSG
jgi:hypothetical protein